MVERFQLRETTAHEQADDAPRPGGEVRKATQSRRRRPRREQRRKGEGTEAAARLQQPGAATQRIPQ